MKKESIALQARNEVAEERNEKAKENLKTLYRQLMEAEDVVSAIKRKVRIEESKLED